MTNNQLAFFVGQECICQRPKKQYLKGKDCMFCFVLESLS